MADEDLAGEPAAWFHEMVAANEQLEKLEPCDLEGVHIDLRPASAPGGPWRPMASLYSHERGVRFQFARGPAGLGLESLELFDGDKLLAGDFEPLWGPNDYALNRVGRAPLRHLRRGWSEEDVGSVFYGHPNHKAFIGSAWISGIAVWGGSYRAAPRLRARLDVLPPTEGTEAIAAYERLEARVRRLATELIEEDPAELQKCLELVLWDVANHAAMFGHLAGELEQRIAHAETARSKQKADADLEEARNAKSRKAAERNAPLIDLARSLLAQNGFRLSLTKCGDEVFAVVQRDDRFTKFRSKGPEAIRELIKAADPPLFREVAPRRWEVVRQG